VCLRIYYALPYFRSLPVNDIIYLCHHSLCVVCVRCGKKIAVALVLPLATYKVAAFVRGQQLMWYLDAAIWLALVTAFEVVFKAF